MFDVITNDAAVVVIIAANAMLPANDVEDEYFSSLLSSVLFSFHTNSSEIKVLERELKNDRLVVAVLIVPLVLNITTGSNVCLSVLHQWILLVQIHLIQFGGGYKTQADTTSKHLPFCFAIRSWIYYYFFTYSAFLFILIENKEKEGFTAPTPSRLGLLS